MSHHVEGQHSTSLALNKADPNTARFESSFDVSKTEKEAVAKRMPKGKAARAPVAR